MPFAGLMIMLQRARRALTSPPFIRARYDIAEEMFIDMRAGAI